MTDEDVDVLRSHIRRQRVLGSPRLQVMVAKTLASLLSLYRAQSRAGSDGGSAVGAPLVELPRHAGGRDDPLVHPHAVYLALGPNVTERCVAYRALFNEAIGDEQLAEIRAYVQQQRALGNDRFQRLIETELGRCTRVRPAHRPRRDAESMPE